jgi:RecA/RadA recombinase
MSRPFINNNVGIGTYLTAREVSLLAGLPMKEVPGIVLKEAVGFGLNTKNIDTNNSICIGDIVQKGRILTDMPFMLNRKVLTKHIFIAGVTGSGKTTTCHRLLYEINHNGNSGKKIPFMVIEPAKTEYRTLVRQKKYFDDVIVFTIGNEQIAPFRLNPFELVKGELITSHVDMLKATFTSAFPMEASMPQLLEEAMYLCYEAMGWDVESNEFLREEDPFDSKVDVFPQLSDLMKALELVVDKKGFDERLKKDYIGSLVSRLSNLTLGSKGLMLNCPHSVDFSYLAKNNVVLELEDIKSGEEKSFIMGLILGRMAAVIKEENRKNPNYQHVTLVEEAHRLLSKVEYGDSGSKKNAVEAFTDLLAEVRKYGEGLIIVDQIPNKLTPEVLKNTNTKIIHRILARDDKEAVGDTMLMNDKQKEYLSALSVGDTIIFTENTDSPVNVHINQFTDTSEEQVPSSEVEANFKAIKHNLGNCYSKYNLARIIKKYPELKNEFIMITERSKEDDDRKKSLADKVSMFMKYVDKFNISKAEIISEVIDRAQIIIGERLIEGLKDYDVYNSNKEVIIKFLTENSTEDITVESVHELKTKYPVFKNIRKR